MRSDYQTYSQPAPSQQHSGYASVEYPAYPSLVPQPASQPAPAQHEPQGYSYAPSLQQDPYAQQYQPQQQQQQHQEHLPSHSGLSTGTAAWDSPGYQQLQSSFEVRSLSELSKQTDKISYPYSQASDPAPICMSSLV